MAQRLAIADPEAMEREVERRAKRRAASRYFFELMRSLSEDCPRPTVPEMSDPEVEEKIRLVSTDITGLYKEFSDDLMRGPIRFWWGRACLTGVTLLSVCAGLLCFPQAACSGAGSLVSRCQARRAPELHVPHMWHLPTAMRRP